MGDGKVTTWETRIKPTHLETASKEALTVIGYKQEDYEDAPLFSEVAKKIVENLKYGPIVAHNAIFDVMYLENALIKNGWTKTILIPYHIG